MAHAIGNLGKLRPGMFRGGGPDGVSRVSSYHCHCACRLIAITNYSIVGVGVARARTVRGPWTASPVARALPQHRGLCAVYTVAAVADVL